MELDLERWHSLQLEILALSAKHRGLGQTLFEMEQQWSQAEAGRLRAHLAYQRLEGRGNTREIAAAAQASLTEATRIVAGYDDKLSALRREQEVLGRRSGGLQGLSQRCLVWAKANGVALPDAELQPGTGVPQATRGREFGATLALGGIPARGSPPPAPEPSAGRSSRGSSPFNMNSRFFNSLGGDAA